MTRTNSLVMGLLAAAAIAACGKEAVVDLELPAPEITFAADTVSIEAGRFTAVTTAVHNTKGTPQFASRDESIATVASNGVISGVAPGFTYIVVTLSNDASVRDSVRVHVLEKFPITGVAVPGMEIYDQVIPDLLKKYSFPGGTVAVVKDGRLVYARGFGYSDLENKTQMQPDALFRIASVSKSLTAVAIMKLVEEGKLKLEDRVAPLIADLKPIDGATKDPRWDQITIRNLLNHTGGWDRAKPGGFDPLDQTVLAAAVVKAPSPASPETVIRWMKGLPLDFNPGEKFVYSNFGYMILGVVIERITGMPYEQYVRSRVLQPVGANRTREGRSLMSQAAPGEVKYYLPGEGVNVPMVPSVFPGVGMVPLNYGGFNLEVDFASGAWISSTIDLLRFLGGIDQRGHGTSILSANLVGEITGNGVAAPCSTGGCFYGGGFWYHPFDGDANWFHGGDLPGATALIVRTYHNYSWVGLFNSNSMWNGFGFDNEFDVTMWNALAKVASFPTHDLFPTFK